ncbi:hypothetical protein AB0L10_42210, partial [Streptomyces flaveolus]
VRRVLQRIARHAPDLPDKVLAWDAVTPPDLAAYNPNAVAGDPYGGSAELDQNLLWRPVPGASRHATPVPRVAHRCLHSPRPRARRRLGTPGGTTAPPRHAPQQPPLTQTRRMRRARGRSTMPSLISVVRVQQVTAPQAASVAIRRRQGG